MAESTNRQPSATQTANHVVDDVARRHDFVLLFDVADGNPNGDPDAGNMPRVDPETMQGLVSDVAIKRKVRDWVDLAQGDQERNKIYVRGDEALNTKHQRAYTARGIKSTGTKQAQSDIESTRQWMCDNFYDIRMFGAVMTTGVNCGQVRGPLQITFARSIDQVVPLDLSITRIAVTREEDRKISSEEDPGKPGKQKQTEMGRKTLVPYGLYRAFGFFNPHFAESTGATSDDLGLFWQALERMWDVDRSSSRGMMSCRGIYVFTHEDKLGNAPAHKLFDRVTVAAREGVKAPRSFSDYSVDVDDSNLPKGITLSRLAE